MQHGLGSDPREPLESSLSGAAATSHDAQRALLHWGFEHTSDPGDYRHPVTGLVIQVRVRFDSMRGGAMNGPNEPEPIPEPDQPDEPDGE